MSPTPARSSMPVWIATQLDNLRPGQWFVIPYHITFTLNLKNFRARIGDMNRTRNLNLKVHVDRSIPPYKPQWWVWYCPDPKPIYKYLKTAPRHLPNPLLSQLQSLHQEFKDAMDRDDITLAVQIQGAMDEIKLKLSTTINSHRKTSPKLFKSKNSISYPLQYILAHLHLTKEQFTKLPIQEQIQLRITAGIALNKLEQASHKNALQKTPDAL